MAKGKSSITKTKKVSGGMTHVTRAKRALVRVLGKIARWERNKANAKPALTKKKKSKVWTRKSRHNNWDTTGLKKQAECLKVEIAKGRRVTTL